MKVFKLRRKKKKKKKEGTWPKVVKRIAMKIDNLLGKTYGGNTLKFLNNSKKIILTYFYEKDSF